MINLSVSVSYAVDYYSILEVKHIKTNYKNSQNLDSCYNNLEKEISNKKLEKILNSKLYKKLLKINKEIFELIDLCHRYPEDIFFIEADKLNNKRFKLKQEIQNKFFKNALTEQKIGYKNNR